MNINQLLEQKSNLETEVTRLQSFISGIPEGTLIARKLPSGAFRYSVKNKTSTGKDQEFYIPREKLKQAEAIALKEYSLNRIKDAQAEIRALDAQIRLLEMKSHTERYLENHPGAAKLIIPRLKNNDDFAEQWEKAPYIRSDKYPEQLKYPTVVPDLLVRSKSEADIVGSFLQYKVPYRYEEQHIINNIVLHPDFTCLNRRTGQIFFLEHQGKWDDPEYVEIVRWRENQYLKAGIYPWKQLLITTETEDHPFDILWFHKIIEYYLL